MLSMLTLGVSQEWIDSPRVGLHWSTRLAAMLTVHGNHLIQAGAEYLPPEGTSKDHTSAGS